MNYKKGKITPDIDPKLTIDKRRLDEIIHDKDDIEFMRKISENLKDLHDLVCAADYLDIPCLISLCSLCIALTLKGKTLEDMKNILESDYSY